MAKGETRSLRPEDLVGTWQLVTAAGHSSAGDILYPYGQAPVGLLMYDGLGNVSVHLMKQGRPKFAVADPLSGTPEEVKNAFEGFDAYYGRYTLNASEGMVTHHLVACRFPNWENTDQVRHVSLTSSELRLRTPPLLARGVEWVFELVWKRVT